MNILTTYSVLLNRSRGWAGQMLLPLGPRRPGTGGRSCPTAHPTAPARSILPQLGTQPAPFTGLTSRPLPPDCCYSSPHRRTHHGAKDRSWTRRPGVAGAVRDLPSPLYSRDPLDTAREKIFRLCRKFCLSGTGSPSPLLNAGDPTPRRGEATQDVLHCHFRGR